MNIVGRVATVMLAGVFVIVGATPAPLARLHPPGMDVTKPEKPHYVLLRRKPEPSPDIAILNHSISWDGVRDPCFWECWPKTAPSVYPPWARDRGQWP